MLTAPVGEHRDYAPGSRAWHRIQGEAHDRAYRSSRGRGGYDGDSRSERRRGPTHDVSQLSQSGAKSAPRKKAEEEPKKAKEQDQRKDEKR